MRETPPPPTARAEVAERWFPLQVADRSSHTYAGAKAWIPWALIAPHEAQALRNHSQSLTRLAERGGLSLSEVAAVVEDRDWRAIPEAEAWATLWRADATRVAAEARLAERERLATVVARGAPVAWANRCDGDALIEASAWERELCEAFHLNEFADFAAPAAPRPAGIEAAARRLAAAVATWRDLGERRQVVSHVDTPESDAEYVRLGPELEIAYREKEAALAAYRQATATGVPAGGGGQG